MPACSHIRFVVDDLTHFKASQTEFEAAFDVVMTFFYLERKIVPEIVKAIRPGGLLGNKTHVKTDIKTHPPLAKVSAGQKNPAHVLEPGELVLFSRPPRVAESPRSP